MKLAVDILIVLDIEFGEEVVAERLDLYLEGVVAIRNIEHE